MARECSHRRQPVETTQQRFELSEIATESANVLLSPASAGFMAFGHFPQAHAWGYTLALARASYKHNLFTAFIF